MAGPRVGPSALCGWAGRPDGQVMFVVQDLTIGTGSRAAQARFANLLHGNWLAETSNRSPAKGGPRGCSGWVRRARSRRSWSGSASSTRCTAGMS